MNDRNSDGNSEFLESERRVETTEEDAVSVEGK